MLARTPPSSLSSEEEVELAKSNKKVKDAHHASFNERPNEGEGPGRKLSFKEKLVGTIPGAFSQAFLFSDHMEAESDSDDEITELNEGMAVVKLFRTDKQRIRAPWTKALIIKVYGRSVSYSFIHSRLQSLWKPTGTLDCVDLGKDFYLVRFSLEEDQASVLEKGPWFIGENFLPIRPWELNFKPYTASVTSIAMWIRLNELPIEYYETQKLEQIGSTIGTVLKIDTHTAVEARGRYARLCVQLDVNKPFITSIQISEFEQFVNYEGIQRLCFSCGCLGHRKESCPYSIKPASP
ncbi:uncharacterized protein LOC142640156 [Castanea sativa]|uniref:uncharacterized protein LOC142640156 n=1 Tax=Castanea sativa TaxID=21020 RepID=UPI003F64EF2E